MSIQNLLKTVIVIFVIPVSIFLLLLYFTGMDYTEHREIIIQNESNDTIYCFYTVNEPPFYKKIYDNKLKEISGDVCLIKPDSSYVKQLIVRGKLDKNDKINFFVITKSYVNQYGWNTIQEHRIYTQKYEYNVHKLDSSQCTIVFPLFH
ncbi:MAG: hypothetical protein LBN23_02100 [Paludibacter sp.]|jgi:hypothetical protein|nr:hypothetical protein [Paludibacter sp.]